MNIEIEIVSVFGPILFDLLYKSWHKSRVAGEHVNASTKRSSKVCYLSDGESRLSEILSQRIANVTGLQIKNHEGHSRNSEDLQVLIK